MVNVSVKKKKSVRCEDFKKKNQQNCLQIKGTAWGTVEDFPLCITGASINEAVHSGCN